MSRFIPGPPLTIAAWRRDDGTPIWITSEEIVFEFGNNDTIIDLIQVPRGFETDLGSIPAILRAIWSPSDPRCARAYVLHDWLNSLTAGRPPGPGVLSSQVAVAVLYEALRLDGAPIWSAMLQTAGVFVGIAPAER